MNRMHFLPRSARALAGGALAPLVLLGAPVAHADSVATFDGYGPVTIGMSMSEAQAALGGSVKKGDFLGCTVLDGGDIQVYVNRENGKVGRISPPAGTLTDRGVGAGSTPAEIKEAYSGYTIDEGIVGGGGTEGINVYEGAKNVEAHRMLGFGLVDGVATTPVIGTPNGWEGC